MNTLIDTLKEFWGLLVITFVIVIFISIWVIFTTLVPENMGNGKVETDIYTQGSLTVTRIYDVEKDNTCYILTDAFSLGNKYEEFYCVP